MHIINQFALKNSIFLIFRNQMSLKKEENVSIEISNHLLTKPENIEQIPSNNSELNEIVASIERHGPPPNSASKRQKTGEDSEVSVHKVPKPADLFERILQNIEKYQFLLDDEFAGPITRKELIEPMSGIKSDRGSSCKKMGKSSISKMIKNGLTVPAAPKFKTDSRVTMRKDKNNSYSTEEIKVKEMEEMRSKLGKQINK
jgi:hypothetical protein